MASILVDTSAVFALLDRDDGNHGAAKRALAAMKRQRLEPLLTNFIVAESHALLLARLNGHVARRWLTSQSWVIERVSADDEARAVSIIAAHIDKTYSYTDATSFAVMERRGVRSALAFDQHFHQYGFQVLGLR